jgi:hypothetical protein
LVHRHPAVAAASLTASTHRRTTPEARSLFRVDGVKHINHRSALWPRHQARELTHARAIHGHVVRP